MASSSSKQSARRRSREAPNQSSIGSVRKIDPEGLKALIQEHEAALGNTLQSIAKQEEYQLEYHTLTNTLKHLPDKLSHDALVPLGPLVMGRGKLIHTNEITCHIGDNWFVQCSANTAQKIAAHRIEKSNEMLRKFEKEKELINSWISEGRRQLAESESQDTVEITEVYDEHQEKEWKKQHRENVRKHYQEAAKEKAKQSSSSAVPLPNSRNTVDQELMDRLDMLELEEELNEYKAKQKQRTEVVKIQPTTVTTVISPPSPSTSENSMAGQVPPANPATAADEDDNESPIPPKTESLQKRRVSFDTSKDTVHSYPAEPKSSVMSTPVLLEQEPADDVVLDAFKHVVIEKTFSTAKKSKPLDPVEDDEEEDEQKPPERMSLFKQRKLMREQEYLT